MNHHKINAVFIIGAFLALLLTPVIKSILEPGHNQAHLEKRRLKNKPNWPNSLESVAGYPEQFEAYFKDNFEFRYQWLSLYKHAKLQLNDPADDKVIFGTEAGWLFFNDRTQNDIVGDFRNINQFTPKQLKQFIKNLKAKQQWLAERGIEYVFVLAPSKHYVYPEFLPKKYRPIQQTNLKKQLATALKAHPEIHFLDLTDIIIAGKKEQRMFLKNDTHWTDYATNLAQLTITKQLSTLFPNQITPIKRSWQLFNNEVAHSGDLEQINGLMGEFTDYRYLPTFKPCAEDLTPPKNETMDTFDTDCQLPLRALVFRDSFFSNLQPFLSEYLGLSRFVWDRMTFTKAQKHIRDIKPDVVIEEWVDRHLPKLRPPK